MEGTSNVMEALAQKQGERSEVDAVMFQVLDNPSLREEILKNVIFGKDTVERKAACTLRLVDKSWNESVVRILRKANQYLFKPGGTKKSVDMFVETFGASAEITGSVPPLAVHDFGDLNDPQGMESFLNCLTRCGAGLILVQFIIKDNGRLFANSPLPTNLSLPHLRDLSVVLRLDIDNHQSQERQGQAAVEDGEMLSTCLMKSVLNSATALKEMSVVTGYSSPVPPERSQFSVFDSVTLPSSITTITICLVGGTTQHVEMLARNPLPNLTSLSLILMRGGLLSNGYLFRILDLYRKSLKTFLLGAGPISADNGQPETVHVTNFPVMEQLQELAIFAANVEPDFGRDCLDKYFPKLVSVELSHQSIDRFQKWMGSSPVPGVTSLRLSLCQNSKPILNVQSMQRIKFVFPNLRKLAVTLSSEDSSGLEYIFREMRQLTELEVGVEVTVEEGTFSDIWDSLLTGVSAEVIARSKEEQDFWERGEVQDENIALIKNLTELKKCSLKLGVAHGQHPSIPHPSMSDFVLNFALLRMPKLVELRLGRQSSHNVSEEMTAKWRNDGRYLTFH